MTDGSRIQNDYKVDSSIMIVQMRRLNEGACQGHTAESGYAELEA